jgi:hypothetical protein
MSLRRHSRALPLLIRLVQQSAPRFASGAVPKTVQLPAMGSICASQMQPLSNGNVLVVGMGRATNFSDVLLKCVEFTQTGVVVAHHSGLVENVRPWFFAITPAGTLLVLHGRNTLHEITREGVRLRQIKPQTLGLLERGAFILGVRLRNGVLVVLRCKRWCTTASVYLYPSLELCAEHDCSHDYSSMLIAFELGVDGTMYLYCKNGYILALDPVTGPGLTGPRLTGFSQAAPYAFYPGFEPGEIYAVCGGLGRFRKLTSEQDVCWRMFSSDGEDATTTRITLCNRRMFVCRPSTGELSILTEDA